MDLVMPNMTGFEATQQLRQLPGLKNIFIAALSASVFEKEQQQSIIAGCDVFMAKPVNTNEFFDVLEAHMDLEWIYDVDDNIRLNDGGTTSSGSEPTEVVPPPPETLATLYDMTMDGDMFNLQEQAQQLEQKDQKYKPFADKLLRLAKIFEDEQILALLEQYMEVSK